MSKRKLAQVVNVDEQHVTKKQKISYNLNNDTLYIVFHFCSITDTFKSLPLVCKFWNSVISADSWWKERATRFFPILSLFSKSPLPWKTMIKYHCPSLIHPSEMPQYNTIYDCIDTLSNKKSSSAAVSASLDFLEHFQKKIPSNFKAYFDKQKEVAENQAAYNALMSSQNNISASEFNERSKKLFLKSVRFQITLGKFVNLLCYLCTNPSLLLVFCCFFFVFVIFFVLFFDR